MVASPPTRRSAPCKPIVATTPCSSCPTRPSRRASCATRSSRAPTPPTVTIVAPALNSRLRHWLSDEDPARRAAAERLERCTAALADAGVRVDGRVGDADPLQAIADALSEFPADELLIVTHPEERSNWLARDLVPRACARFSLPVLHLVVEGVEARPPVLAAA